MPQDREQVADEQGNGGTVPSDSGQARQDDQGAGGAQDPGGDRLGPAGEAALKKERDEVARLRKQLRELQRADEDRRAQEQEERDRALPEIDQLRRRASDASTQAEQHRRDAERLAGELVRERRANAIYQAAAPLAESPALICKILSDSDEITHDPEAPASHQFKGVKEAVERLLKKHPELGRQGSQLSGALPRDPRPGPGGNAGGRASGQAPTREAVSDQLAQYGLTY